MYVQVHSRALVIVPKSYDKVSSHQPCVHVIRSVLEFSSQYLFVAMATKYCDPNGTWYTHPEIGTEMSDYTQCIDLTVYPNTYLSLMLCAKLTN